MASEIPGVTIPDGITVEQREGEPGYCVRCTDHAGQQHERRAAASYRLQSVVDYMAWKHLAPSLLARIRADERLKFQGLQAPSPRRAQSFLEITGADGVEIFTGPPEAVNGYIAELRALRMVDDA